MNEHVSRLQAQVAPIRAQIVQHPAYAAIRDLDGIRAFMEHHIYAVWDFMSLLKTLQNQLTCTSVPWLPTGSPEARFLINEIVVGEEADVDQQGRRTSHFELYLEAMQQCGAATSGIGTLIAALADGQPLAHALEQAPIPPAARQFLDFTFEVIATDRPHIVAAVFTFGREDLIPNMFRAIVNDVDARLPSQVEVFKYYLDRHIEVDGGSHGKLALQMVTELCGDDDHKWAEATSYTARALASRVALWDGVLDAIESDRASVAS